MDTRQQRKAEITQRYIGNLDRLIRASDARIAKLDLDRRQDADGYLIMNRDEEQEAVAIQAEAFGYESPQAFLNAHHGGDVRDFSRTTRASHEYDHGAGSTPDPAARPETIAAIAEQMGVAPPRS